MDWQEILEITIVSGIITTAAGAWLNHFFGRRMKRFETNIELENVKNLEAFKLNLEADMKDTLRLREKRFNTISELCGKVGKIQFVFSGLIGPSNDFPNLPSMYKSYLEGEAALEKLTKLLADFSESYMSNRVLFTKETCSAIDKLIAALTPIWLIAMGELEALMSEDRKAFRQFYREIDADKLKEFRDGIANAQVLFEKEARKYL